MTTLRDQETALIVSVQRWPVARGFVPVARLLSLFGEHAAGWIVLGVIGAVVDEHRRIAWLAAVAAVIVAHGLSIVVKRVVRRRRPERGQVRVLSTAPSALSFPSSHASSTMAAAIVFTALLPFLWPLAMLVVLLMGFSRVCLGMHFPTDVLAGYGIGILVGLPIALLTL